MGTATLIHDGGGLSLDARTNELKLLSPQLLSEEISVRFDEIATHPGVLAMTGTMHFSQQFWALPVP
jgi:hypothetical protein